MCSMSHLAGLTLWGSERASMLDTRDLAVYPSNSTASDYVTGLVIGVYDRDESSEEE